MTPGLIEKSSPLDLDLCALLGKGTSDFIVLCADGEPVPFTGTPFDTPENRERQQDLVDLLNSRKKDSCWPSFFTNWKAQFCKAYNLSGDVTPKQFHPEFSFKISRVCHAYSERFHVAISLFEELGERLNSWSIIKNPNGTASVDLIAASGTRFREGGKDIALLIASAAKRLLEAEQATSSTDH